MRSALTAGQFVDRLVSQVTTAQVSVVYTAADDPNNLLGRPGGYTSKATFIDSRIDPKEAKSTERGSVDIGGSIEVFNTADEALRRGKYIQSVIGTFGLLGHEYDFTSDGVLLRLSAVFTPEQATAYAGALAAITGQDSNSVS